MQHSMMTGEITIESRLQHPFALPSPLEEARHKSGLVVGWKPPKKLLQSLSERPRISHPCSYQQEQHLRHFHALKRRGQDKERLLVLAWDMPGNCQIDKMSVVINRHLQRHDTYHIWHHFDEEDPPVQTSRVIEASEIQLEPTSLGWMDSSDWIHALLSTPGTDQWNCFLFGVIQREHDFTFFACIDHLYVDGYILPIIFAEIQEDYQWLVSEGTPMTFPPTASYRDYCQRQRRHNARLTLEHPDIQEWLMFLRRNNGQVPRWPLELQTDDEIWQSRISTMSLLDADETSNFVRYCRSIGVPFLIGMLSSFAVAEHILTGRSEVHLVTPVTNRASKTEFRTMGWFTGLVPVSITGFELDMATVMQRAKESFTARRHLASIPIERLIELTAEQTEIRWHPSGSFMFSCGMPASDKLIRSFYESNGCFYLNQGLSSGIPLWITKSCQGTSASISHPASLQAKESMGRVMERFSHVCRQVSQGDLERVIEIVQL